jgi:threonine aldolase
MPLDMLKAMSIAKVGDDVFEDDPTAHELQNSFARLFNK